MNLIDIKHNLISNQIYNDCLKIIKTNKQHYKYDIGIMKNVLFTVLNNLQQKKYSIEYSFSEYWRNITFDWGDIDLYYHTHFYIRTTKSKKDFVMTINFKNEYISLTINKKTYSDELHNYQIILNIFTDTF